MHVVYINMDHVVYINMDHVAYINMDSIYHEKCKEFTFKVMWVVAIALIHLLPYTAQCLTL